MTDLEKLNALKVQLSTAQEKVSDLKSLIHSQQLQMIEASLDAKMAKCDCGGPLKKRRPLVSRWDCKQSPIGNCVYDLATDPWHDDCLFCGEPEERT